MRKSAMSMTAMENGDSASSMESGLRLVAWTTVLLTAIFLSIALRVYVSQPAFAQGSTISGSIIRPDMTPTENWCATLYILNVESDEYEQTDFVCAFNSNGEYTFNSVAVGTYRIGFQEVNGIGPYRPEYYDDVYTLEEATDISIAAGQTITGIDAKLELRTGIEGNVIDGIGKNLQNIAVGIYRRGADSPGGGETWNLVTSEITNRWGNYRFYDIPTDHYRVGFTDGFALYKTEYYSGTYYIQNAQDIVIEEETFVEGVNAQLEGITLNAPPLAVNDVVTVTTPGGSAIFPATGPSVLSNDIDAENDVLSARLVSSPQSGIVELNADGTFLYTYSGNGKTSDSFTYRASDGQSVSAAATVLLLITSSGQEVPTATSTPAATPVPPTSTPLPTSTTEPAPTTTPTPSANNQSMNIYLPSINR